MQISLGGRTYTALVLGLILLLISFIISYKNIYSNNKLLTQLDREQIKLNYYTNKLNYDVKNIQVSLLQELLLHHTLSDKMQNFDKIQKDIHQLEKYATKNNLSEEYVRILHKLNNRLVAYKLVRDSLIEAVSSNEEIDIQDAIIGFNSITLKFAQDTKRLVELANAALYQRIFRVKETNTTSSYLIIFSFILSMLLLAAAFYKFYTLQKSLKRQLERAQKAENELKASEVKLLSYNQDLEREVKEKSEEILKKIYTHPITKLPNRNRLLEDMQEYNFSCMAILNIDKFQSFNDVYGEESGNEALKYTAKFLEKKVDELPFMLYHIGGDEFTIVALHNISINEAEFISYIKELLNEYAKEAFSHGSTQSYFKISAGVACTNDNRMLAYADMALKEAKTKNIALSIFNKDKDLEQEHKDDMLYRKKINYALEHNTILSHFQPIVPIQESNKPFKYESLVRLKDEDGNIIAPFKFLDVAKRHKLYDKITEKVVDNTLQAIQTYNIPCSLNISLADMANDETMHYLEKQLENFSQKELLTIELLETEDFQNYDLVLKFCEKVKEYGVKIALDDFGSGYSNFAHVLKLPIDFIKIDASLISNINTDEHSKIMVQTIIDLAKRLGVETIAEFVASKEILDTVKKLGVDYAQGYYLGKPLSIEEHIKSKVS